MLGLDLTETGAFGEGGIDRMLGVVLDGVDRERGHPETELVGLEEAVGRNWLGKELILKLGEDCEAVGKVRHQDERVFAVDLALEVLEDGQEQKVRG